MGIAVTRRGGEVPDKGDVDAAGLPVTTTASIAKNAWILWRRARTEAAAHGMQAIRDGAEGWEWHGTLVDLEQDIWEHMTGSARDARYRAATTARKQLRLYLRESGNVVIAGEAHRGGGPSGTRWWIRDTWNDAVPSLWSADRSDDSAKARRGDVTVSWKCPDCGSEQPGRISLSEHRAKEHPVQAPELPGVNFYDDILTCMGSEDRMANADLAILLAAGNPDAYGSMGGIIMFGKRLVAAGIPYQQLWIGPGREGTARTAVRREDVVAAKERAEDAEAQVIVEQARAADPAADAKANRQVLLGALDAILDRNKALERLTKEQAAELARLRKQPVSQDVIDAAIAKITGPLKAENENLKRRLEAARKVIGLG